MFLLGLATLASDELLAVGVNLQVGDDEVGSSKVHGHGVTTGLVSRDLLDVNSVFQTVDSRNFALLALVGATDNLDGVVTADGESTHTVLSTELLREGSAHDHTTDVRGSLEVLLPGLGARAGHLRVLLHAKKIMYGVEDPIWNFGRGFSHCGEAVPCPNRA